MTKLFVAALWFRRTIIPSDLQQSLTDLAFKALVSGPSMAARRLKISGSGACIMARGKIELDQEETADASHGIPTSNTK